jgi:hypothetical protein
MANAVCCEYQALGFLGDLCCGKGQCNIFYCNCDNGCKSLSVCHATLGSWDIFGRKKRDLEAFVDGDESDGMSFQAFSNFML